MIRPIFLSKQIVAFTAILALAATESRAAGANVYLQHNLVSDVPGLADVTDPNLINPWGISVSATSPFWISDRGKGVSTLYNGSGTITPLVAIVPAASGATQGGSPTGQVNNSNTTAFLLPNGRAASFIFCTEDGTISGWAGGITGNISVIMANNSSNAVYKGLAIGANSSGPLLYAANFKTGTIDVFDGKYNAYKTTGGFLDTTIPAGFAPFNIWALGGKLYVAYAKQDAQFRNDVAGAGNGFVNVFDFDGNLQKRLISNGALNSPWGLALAPATFGAFGGALLVGNFGDGKINAFDSTSGASLGTLQDANGKPIVIGGLWALLFGNGANGGDRNTLYFTAGINGEIDGLLGSIAPPSAILNVQNAASWASGSVVPGEVVSLTGLTIGPSPGASATIPVSGSVSTALGGVTVTFNGVSAPILYASASQINALVPYAIISYASANITVKYRGQTATTSVPVANAAPGLFTTDFSGNGQVVALNVDDTLNSSKNPAAAGSIITLFGTGEGATNPPGEDGFVNDRILRQPILPVTVTIGGQRAQLLYAGTAVGQEQGILQVEAVIPGGLTGNVPVVVTVGPASSQATATISVN